MGASLASPLIHGLFLFAAAAIAGTLNAVAGGGSFISFPALLSTGVPAIQANATNTVALWPGLAASTGAYLKRLDVPRALLIPLVATSVVGGFAGSLLLLKTPQHVFMRLVPWLLLSGTLLFAFGNQIRAIVGKNAAMEDWRALTWQAITVSSFVELLIGIYGGYFGAGIGFITLAMLAALGMHDIHAMGAIRTLLAVVINAAAVLIFILARAVFWPQCLVMVAGATVGGWFGAHYAQKADPVKVRRVIIGIGMVMTAYYFITVR
ncbi:MAG: sulfite exporter TauE/SafE family protein [Candidatus Korobacteraceae bacterium]